MRRGIPVFNAPYSNTRSVAELVIGEIIILSTADLPAFDVRPSGRLGEVRGW